MTILINILRGTFKKLGRLFKNPYKKIGLNWFQARRLKNLPSNKPNFTPFFSHKVRFKHHNEFLHSIDEIYFKEIYKTDFGNIIDPYILDCGANIGLSVIYFKIFYPQANVIAFEPDASNLEILKANITSMQLGGVSTRQEAVWKDNSILKFRSQGTQSSKIDINQPNNTAEEVINVKAIRLKDLIINRVDLLKLDIEGAEYEVIRDIEGKMYLIDRIFLEYHGSFNEAYKLEEMLAILSKNGFKYYITEANEVYSTPFYRTKSSPDYDVQLNISCFKD